MVIVNIVGLFESLIYTLLSVIPDPSVPGLNSLATTVVGESWFGYLGWVNDYIPLDAMVAAALMVVGVWSVMWVVKLVIWLLGKFHVFGAGE